jgi:hypothetical protein
MSMPKGVQMPDDIGNTNGCFPTLVDEDGTILEMCTQPCQAKSSELRRCLDNSHQAIGTKHRARTPEGILISF